MRKLTVISMVLSTYLFTCGCATMKHNYIPEISQLDFPQLNKETTVYVGEAMLIQGFSAKQDVLHVKYEIDGACYNIPRGMYPKTGQDPKREYFSYMNGNTAVTRSGLCDPVNGMYVDEKNKNEVCIVTIFNATSCYSGDLEIKKLSIVSMEHMQRSLVFSGKEGDKINFLYVEKSGPQTLYSHNVSYNIKDSKIIGYRGAKIEIIGASNENITYTVINNFPDRERLNDITTN